MALLAAGPGLGSRSHRGPETQGEGQARDGGGLIRKVRQGGGGSTEAGVQGQGVSPSSAGRLRGQPSPLGLRLLRCTWKGLELEIVKEPQCAKTIFFALCVRLCPHWCFP